MRTITVGKWIVTAFVLQRWLCRRYNGSVALGRIEIAWEAA